MGKLTVLGSLCAFVGYYVAFNCNENTKLLVLVVVTILGVAGQLLSEYQEQKSDRPDKSLDR